MRALRAEFDEILADPAFHNAYWGVMVQSVETGEILYRANARKLFMPASNMKLVTGAVALHMLGADHRFQTRITACGRLQADGTLNGDLLVVGGGDPSISARFNDGDSRATFRAWADTLRRRGITRVAGDIVGDDDFFDDVHIGPGWAWDYLDATYAAEIGALLYNEGAVRYRISHADSAGHLARVVADPPTSYLKVGNDVITVTDSTGLRLSAARSPFSNNAHLTGSIWIGSDSLERDLAPHDPTLFFVTVLRETLAEQGIEVAGRPVDRDDRASDCDEEETIFVHESPKLHEILKPFLKESQNQIGEMLMRYLGAVQTDTGSVATGRRVVSGTLTAWGIPSDAYVYYDGSGLSRYNYLSPEAVVRLLHTMARHRDFAAYYDALPVAGVDGTLEHRMRGTLAEGNARAKTGFISNARALSGYVTTRDGELLAFSIIANNFLTPVRPVEYVQDLLVERLAHFSRSGNPTPGR